MAQRDLRLLVSTTLLVFMAVVVLTGVVADSLDLNRFVYHRYPAYAAAALLALHLILNWRSFRGQWALKLGASGRPRPATADGGAESRVVRSEREWRSGGIGRRSLLAAGAGAVLGLVVGWITSPRPWVSAALGGDVGKLYHNWSKPGYAGLLAAALLGGTADGKGRPGRGDIALPKDFSDRGLSLEEAIERRRSVRAYADRPMPLLQLSRLLYRAGGVTDRALGLRAAPSAGALYPLELYVVANNVADLQRGIYRYDPEGHSLRTMRNGDFRGSLVVAALGQDMVASAPVVLVIAAVFERTRRKYRERSYRYVLMECGHVAQNVYLAATSMGMGACAVGAFLDDELNGLLGLDGEDEAALYIIPVGAR